MNYKLFLDDLREPAMCAKMMPNHADLYNNTKWVIARNYTEFCDIIREKWLVYNWAPSLISFDHDLGFENEGTNLSSLDNTNIVEKTGKDCANWLIRFCEDNRMPFPNYIVHSANPVGSKNISGLLDHYKKHISNGKSKI